MLCLRLQPLLLKVALPTPIAVSEGPSQPSTSLQGQLRPCLQLSSTSPSAQLCPVPTPLTAVVPSPLPEGFPHRAVNLRICFLGTGLGENRRKGKGKKGEQRKGRGPTGEGIFAHGSVLGSTSQRRQYKRPPSCLFPGKLNVVKPYDSNF